MKTPHVTHSHMRRTDRAGVADVLARISHEIVWRFLKREKPGRTDREAIEGIWKVVDATVSGKKVEGTELGENGVLHLATLNLFFIFEGDKWKSKAVDKTESRRKSLEPGPWTI